MPKVDLSKINIADIPVYIQVGADIIKIASGPLASIRAALQSAPDVEVDNATLDATDKKYTDRIGRARDAADGD